LGGRARGGKGGGGRGGGGIRHKYKRGKKNTGGYSLITLTWKEKKKGDG